MSTSSFVDQLYTKFFGRAADAAGKSYWSHLLDSGAVNAAQVTQTFLDSPEFSAIVQPVARLYFTAFARIPDAGGLGAWISAAQSGMPLGDISAQFVASAEFAHTYGALDNGAFLDLLYQNSLGRGADAAGKAYWLDQMAKHGATRAIVLTAFADSPELVAAKSDAVKIISEYHATLGAAPTQLQIDSAIIQNNPLGLITSLYASHAYQGAPVPGLIGSGTLVDGYIKGATVFIDTNGNGKLDAGEFSTLTDAQGNFSFGSHAGYGGTLVTIGGTDISTGKAVDASYMAPAGSTVINPLTTLMVHIANASGISMGAASALLGKQFGLSTDIDLTSFDPIAAAVRDGASGDDQARALAIQKVAAQVATLVSQAGALLRGAGVEHDSSTADAAVFKALAHYLADPARVTGDALDNSSAIRDIISAATAALTNNPLVKALIDAFAKDAAAVIAQINSVLDQVGSFDPFASLGHIALIQTNAGGIADGIVSGLLHGFFDSLQLGNLASQLLTVHGGGFGAAIIQDTTAPTLSTISPSNGASSIAPGTNITLVFSEPVFAGSGSIVITDGATQSVVTPSGDIVTRLFGATDTRTVSISDSSQVTISGNTVTINLSGDLKPNLSYNVLMGSGTIKDGADNPYAGIGPGTGNNFSTGISTDTTAPLLSTTSPLDNASGVAGGADIVLTFNESVKAGSGQIIITDGAGDSRNINVGDTGQVSFAGNTVHINPTLDLAGSSHYTVQMGDGVIVDLANNHFAGLSGAALDFNTAAGAADTTAPTIAIALDKSTLKIGETMQVTLTFSEAVTGFDVGMLAFLSTGAGTFSNFTGSGTTYFASFTPSTDLTSTGNTVTLDLAGRGVTDLAGNPLSAPATSAGFSVDTRAPTVVGVFLGDTNLGADETTSLTVFFSEAVSAVDAADFIVPNASLGSFSHNGDFTQWTSTLTPANNTNDATNVITVLASGVLDLAGNSGSGNVASSNYAVNTLRPNGTVSISSNTVAADLSYLVTITFNSAVSGFSNADLSVPNGSLSAVSSNDGGITWTANYSANSNVMAANNVITLNNAGVTNSAANAGVGSSTSNSFAIDSVRPTATVTVVDNSLRIGETSLVFIDFSEAVSDFTLSDMYAPAGTLSALTTLNNVNYTATYTPNAGAYSPTTFLTIDNTAQQDAFGNPGAGTTNSNAFLVDTLAPTSTISISDTALKIGDVAVLTITFSESVIGLSAADLTYSNGTIGAFTSNLAGTIWTANYTPNSNVVAASNTITMNNSGVLDLNANVGSGTSSTVNFAIETVAPTATITVADTALMSGDTSLVTFAFSEAISGFTNADLSIPNGSLSPVSSSDGGFTFTATFTPSANVSDNTNTIVLTASGVTDPAGNSPAANVSSNNFIVDNVRPTVTSFTLSDMALLAADSATVTIIFSEPVTNFSNADVLVNNGNLSTLSSTDNITWTGTLTPTVNVNSPNNLISIDMATLNDVAGNPGTGSASSPNYAITSVIPTATVNSTVYINDSGISSTDFITNIANQTISGTYTGVLGGGDTLQYKLSSSASWTNVSANNGSFVIFDTFGHSDTMNFRITNSQGNSSAMVSQAFTLDTTAPTLVSTSIADNATGVDPTSNVVWHFSEAIGIVSNINSKLDYGITGQEIPTGVLLTNSQITIGGSNLIFNPSTDLQNAANYTLGFSNGAISDIAGNNYVNTDLHFTTAGPGAPDLQGTSDSGSSNTDNLTNVTTPTFSGTLARAGSTVKLYDGANLVGTTTANGAGGWTITSSMLGEGMHMMSVTDTLGANTSNASPQLHVTIDTTAPLLSASTPFNPSNGDSSVTGSQNIIITFDENVAFGAGSIGLYDALVPTLAATTNSISGAALTLNPDVDMNYASNYYVQFGVAAITDAAGNPFVGLTGNSDYTFFVYSP